VNILLCSVGRRPYLVRWFREALRDTGVDGKVIAADLDELAPAGEFADEFVAAPRSSDPGYRDWLAALLRESDISLAVSINDFELSEWSLLPREKEWAALVRLETQVQQLVEDKFAMSSALADAGIPTPFTWLGTEAGEIAGQGEEFVTKGRFGSASRGLRFPESAELERAVAAASAEVTTRQSVPALEQDEFLPEELVIIQKRVSGVEYGLDIVSDFDGTFAGVLARRKIVMRAGETDRAESVEVGAFEHIARKISEVVPHPGTIDVDVIVDDDGQPWVIDINPRFGGGYPFSHLAGARVPHAYVAWAAGLPVEAEWLNSSSGVTGGKYVEAVRVR